MGSKSPTQTTTTNTPPPQVLAEYGTVTNRANQVANTPYTPYNGQLVAPVNQQQTTGIGGVNSYANAAQPYLTGAAGLTLAGAGPANAQQFSPDALNQYMSPYTQDVVNATQAAFQNQNTQQAQSLEGQTIGAGAFGGDRAGVAQGILAGQQQTAEAPVIAGLYNQNYTQALGEFNTQQQTNLSAEQANLARLQGAGLQLGNIGTASQTAGLQGAGAQLQAGTLQQQTQQAADTAAYNQFLQQQAYPFQTAQFQANIAEGIGSNSGGTSTSSTSAPNSIAPYIGAGLGLLAAAARGGRILPKYAGGGLVIDARHRFAGGGGLVIPYASNEGNVDSWVPQTGALPIGHSMPTAAPANSNNQQNQNLQAMQSIGSGIGKIGNSGIGDAISDFAQDFSFANGGLVLRRGYDDGGMTDPSPADLAMLRAAVLAAPPQQSAGAIDPSIAARAIAAQQGKFQNRVSPETQYPLSPSQTSPPVSSVAAPGTLAAYRDSILNPPASAPVAAANPAPFPVTAPPGLAYSNNGAPAFPASAYVPRETQASFTSPSAGLMASPLAPSAPMPDATPPPQNSSGLFGLHLSDPVRAGLLSAAFGIMASPSRNLAMAIGQGGQQGVATYEKALDQAREQMLTKAQIANYQSEVANRPQDIAVRSRALDNQATQISNDIAKTGIEQQNANTTAKNVASEVGLRQAQTATALQTSTPAGLIVRDPANPTAPPKLIPWSAMGGPQGPQGPQAPGAGATATSGAQPPIDPRLFSPEGQKIAADETNEALKTARTAFEGSQNTKVYLQQMKDAVVNLPQTGWLAQGPGLTERANLANTYNIVARNLGISEIDPTAIASSEELNKLTSKMGFELARSLGGREPGFIVQQATRSVPSQDNSSMGFQRLVAGIQSMAQRQEDYYKGMQDWTAKSGGSIYGFDDAFAKAHPPEQYAAQAILSTIPPAATAYLKQHPETRGQFDAKYGPVSQMALGQ